MRTFRKRYKDRNGRRKESPSFYVEFKDHCGVWRQVRGFTERDRAAALGLRIDRLVSCRATGEPPGPELAEWVENLAPKLRERLARWGILDARRLATARPLEEHLADFERSFMNASLDAAAQSGESERFEQPPPTGLEPVTTGLEIRCSVQLS